MLAAFTHRLAMNSSCFARQSLQSLLQLSWVIIQGICTPKLSLWDLVSKGNCNSHVCSGTKELQPVSVAPHSSKGGINSIVLCHRSISGAATIKVSSYWKLHGHDIIPLADGIRSHFKVGTISYQYLHVVKYFLQLLSVKDKLPKHFKPSLIISY